MIRNRPISAGLAQRYGLDIKALNIPLKSSNVSGKGHRLYQRVDMNVTDQLDPTTLDNKATVGAYLTTVSRVGEVKQGG